MEKFNITNTTKRSIAKKVKNEILEQYASNAKSIYYGEFAIFYKTPTLNDKGYFYQVGTTQIEKEEAEGNCLYKIITFDNKNIEKTTLKEIEEKIFN